MRDRNDPGTGTDQQALTLSREMQSSRNEMYNRLRAIIDNATQAVRSLKEENAALAQRNLELEDRTAALEQRLRLLTSGLTQDEQALKQSIDRLAQTLQMPIAPAAPAPASAAAPSAAPASAPVAPEPPAPAPAPEPTPPAEATARPEPTPEAPSIQEMAASTELPIAVREVPQEPAAVARAEPAGEPTPPGPGHAAPTAEMPAAATTGGVYTLITYPFVRFSDLGQFQAALQRLQGIHDVQVRRFAQGTLEMTARYEGETDLMTALRGMTTEIEEVREEAPYRLRIRLRARTDA